MGLTAAPLTQIDRTYLDTYDWRLFRKGQVLVDEARDDERTLVLQSRGTGRADLTVPTGQRPRAGHDLPESVQRRVGAAVSARTLVDVGHEHVELWPLRLLDGDGKTVAHVDVERVEHDHDGTSVRVQLRSVRGYESVTRRVEAMLDSQADLRRADDPMVRAARIAGAEPGRTPGPPPYELVPSAPSTAALAGLLEHELATLIAFEDGVRRQLDPEVLHDYRIGVRRTRAIVSLAKRSLPDSITHVWTLEWKWLASVTSPARDLDVLRAELDSARGDLPADSEPGLDELIERVRVKRDHVQIAMRTALDGDRYGTLKRGWREAVRELASMPSKETAADIASALAERAVKQVARSARSLHDDAPVEAIHDVRKRVKRLRYSLELFGPAWAKGRAKRLIRATKRLQDDLGAFQDNEVHRRLVMALLDADTVVSPAASAVGLLLLERYDARRVSARRGLGEQLRNYTKHAPAVG